MKLYFLDVSAANEARVSELGGLFARCVLSRETGEYVSESDIFRAANGKPRMRNEALRFNISHSGSLIMLGVGRRELGVDIQRHRPVTRALARRVCAAAELDFLGASRDFERDFFRLWCLKESFMKADGGGLSLGMRNISFDLSEYESDSRIVSAIGGAEFALYEGIDGFTAAVCELST